MKNEEVSNKNLINHKLVNFHEEFFMEKDRVLKRNEFRV